MGFLVPQIGAQNRGTNRGEGLLGLKDRVSFRHALIVAISRIQTIDSGMRTFQPIAISWSYRVRGSVPRSQT